MNCEKYSEWISLYIDGELPEKDRVVLEDHIKSCDSCREEVQIFRQITNDLENLEMIDVPKGFHKDLMGKIKLESKQGQRKWYTNFKIASAVAAAFVFSAIMIKPILLDKPMKSVPETAMMEESQEIEDNMSRGRMMPESPENILEDAPVDSPRDLQIESVADAAQIPIDEPTVAQAMLGSADTPIQTCTVMTGEPHENKDYIIDLAKTLGVEATIIEITGSEELKNLIITIEMIINKEQGLELDDKMRGLEKFYEGPDYEQEQGYPEIVKLIIIVTEYHSN